MNRNKRIFVGSSVIPAAIGILALVFIVFLMGPSSVDVSGADFYNVQSVAGEKVIGSFQGMLSDGDVVTDNDVVNITAINISAPSTTITEDMLVIDIIVNNSAGATKYWTTWGLTYNGTGAEFTGNITIDMDLIQNYQSSSDGIQIKAENGDMVTLRKNNTNDAPLLYFMVDTNGPTIAPVEPGASVATYSSVVYAKSNGMLNLTLTDISADQQWFVDNSKVTYLWDQGTSSIWDGKAITIPSSYGNHTLNVTATDKFDMSQTILKTYNVTYFLTDPTLSDNVTITSGPVFISTTEVGDGLTLSIKHSEVVFLGYGDGVTVKDGGELVVENCTITSKGELYTITTDDGAELDLSDSNVYGPVLTTSDSSIMSLMSGELHNVTFYDITNKISILSQGVEISHSTMELDGSGMINIDMRHTWDSIPTNLMNITINGTSFTPIMVNNVSTWTPYDVTDRYYEDDTTGTVYFYVDMMNMTNPYMKLPYFMDSRSPLAQLDLEYNDTGIWRSFAGYPKGNIVFNEWINGDDAMVDLSFLTEDAYQLRATWTSPSDNMGCVYIGEPRMGSDNTEEIAPGASSFTWDHSKWGTGTITTGDVLVLKNITVDDATTNFIKIHSSGDVMVSEMNLGDPSADLEANEFIMISDSSVNIHNTTIVGNDNTQYGVKVDFDAGNDWGTSIIDGLDISINGTHLMDAGIYSEGGWISTQNINIQNTTYGVRVVDGFLIASGSTIDPSETGIFVTLPGSYPADVAFDIMTTTVSSTYGVSGIYLEGDAIDYPIDITVKDFDVFTSNSTSYVRSDGVGGVTVYLTSSETANIMISGNVTGGSSHGIAVPYWPSDGKVSITTSRITNVNLDGIFLGDGFNANITDVSISQCNVGIYVGDDFEIGFVGGGVKSLISSMGSGGISIGDNAVFNFNYINLSFCNGPGITLGSGSTGSIFDTEIYTCNSGLTIGDGSDVDIFGLDVESTTQGYGLFAKNSDLTLDIGSDINHIVSNNGDGILLEGGSLSIDRTWINYNSGQGINLVGVDLQQMKDIKIIGNNDDGLTIHITSESLLDMDGYYGRINNTDVTDNSGTGLLISYDPTQITKTIEIELQGPRIGGNPGGDILSPRNVHITWTSVLNGRDILGSDSVTGVIRANFDVEISDHSDAMVQNLNITLLGNSNGFHVSELGTLNLVNCYIRPSQSDNRFYITGDTLSSIQIEGGYLGQLYKLEVIGGRAFTMDGTLIRFGEGPIRLESTPMLIEDSEFSDIEGTALLVIDGEGTIQGTKFTHNTIGLQVEGLDDDLQIRECEFVDNKWGISLFNDSSQTVSIVDSYFSGNSPAPIWTATANAQVLDSFVDPYSIQVTQEDYSVRLSYTLEVELLNEVGDYVEFDLKVDRGPGNNIVNNFGIPMKFTNSYQSYQVKSDEVIDDDLTVELTITYEEGLDADRIPIMAEILDSFDLDRGISITYYGYQAPTKTGDAPVGSLLADEDHGLRGGPVDVEPWFKDIGDDQGNLTYTVQQLTADIFPFLEGNKLDLRITQDWNGRGNLSVKATDPHGVSFTWFVSVHVLEVNDQPMVTNPRIIALDSDSPTVPRTHDTIQGVWEWFDVDGDNEPQGHIIHWYLNGTHMPSYDNNIKVEGVYAGQIWNFTIFPADNIGIGAGEYGIPAHSPPVMIGNIPPRLNSATITTLNPTTLTDLMASPGLWEDPETNVVTFNYLWEKKTQSGYESVGAPNSPILDHRFTSRGDTIRVKVWVSDGFSISEVRTSEVYIRNSVPYISSAKLMPSLVDENTERVYIEDLVWGDPDGDLVTISYQWYVRGYPIAISDTWSEIQKSEGNWNYPANISVGITPYDSNNLPGVTFYLSVYVTPTDTDGDGQLDDANGNGKNDPNDDKDDDDDGFFDEWEEVMKTNPKDRFDMPMDSDGDGLPDGDDKNSELWMDLDDDNDGIWDIHPQNEDMNDPKWFDTRPKTASRPGDMDYDGIGDDQDPDIDGDLRLNEDDFAPRDPSIQDPPTEKETLWIQILTLLLVLLIILAIVVFLYLVYNGTINLPTQAPPPVSGGDAEAIYDDDEPGVAKLPPKIDDGEELEELDSMSICSSCGDLVSLEEPNCPNCGAEFEELEEEDDDEEELDFDDEFDD